jgi:hypothetical protein
MDQKTIDGLFTFRDRNENSFFCENGKLTMKLKDNKRIFHIGEILRLKGLLIYKKKEKEKDVHRGTNSWTVPVPIFDKVDGMWYQSEKYNYKILKTKAKENKPLLNYRKWGSELKVCIPLQIWTTKIIS